MDTENVKMLETIVNIDNKNRGDGIRTHGGIAPTQPFQDCTLNLSDTQTKVGRIGLEPTEPEGTRFTV